MSETNVLQTVATATARFASWKIADIRSAVGESMMLEFGTGHKWDDDQISNREIRLLILAESLAQVAMLADLMSSGKGDEMVQEFRKNRCNPVDVVESPEE